jgi:hypothetical protein
VQYPKDWTVVDAGDDHVMLRVVEHFPDGQTADLGTILVTGMNADRSVGQLVDDAAAALPDATYEKRGQVAGIEGARVGFIDGAGKIWDANELANGAQTNHVRIAILAAAQGGRAIVVRAISPFSNDARSPSGLTSAGLVDYVITELTWP